MRTRMYGGVGGAVRLPYPYFFAPGAPRFDEGAAPIHGPPHSVRLERTARSGDRQGLMRCDPSSPAVGHARTAQISAALGHFGVLKPVPQTGGASVQAVFSKLFEVAAGVKARARSATLGFRFLTS